MGSVVNDEARLQRFFDLRPRPTLAYRCADCDKPRLIAGVYRDGPDRWWFVTELGDQGLRAFRRQLEQQGHPRDWLIGDLATGADPQPLGVLAADAGQPVPMSEDADALADGRRIELPGPSFRVHGFRVPFVMALTDEPFSSPTRCRRHGSVDLSWRETLADLALATERPVQWVHCRPRRPM